MLVVFAQLNLHGHQVLFLKHGTHFGHQGQLVLGSHAVFGLGHVRRPTFNDFLPYLGTLVDFSTGSINIK